MNKKILGALVALLTIALLTVPVMAAPATKIEGVTFSLVHQATGEPVRSVAHDTIIHTIGTSFGTATITVEDDTLEGTWNTTWTSTVELPSHPNPDPEGGNIIREKVVITYTGDEEGTTDRFEGMTGTFEGSAQYKWVGIIDLSTTPPTFPSSIAFHMVLRGTDDFQGWTLKLSYEGPSVLPTVAEGTLIIPN